MKLIIYLLIYCLLFINLSFADDYEKYSRFAVELMNQGEYYRAITEFYRINSYYPENPNYLLNLENISKCHYLSDRKLEAIDVYNKILQKDRNNWNAIFNTAKIYNEISYYYESNKFIDLNLDKFSDSKLDSLFLLSAINSIYLEKYKNANNSLEKIDKNSVMKPKADIFINYIKNQTPLKLKHKEKAVIIGMIPGGGYFYTKRTQTGIAAFIVNLLFGYATYESFNKDQVGLGTVSSIFSISFYLGSIYGSMQAVDNFNYKLKLNFSKQFNF